MKTFRLLAIFFAFAIVFVVTSANAATWTTINGRILTQTGTPVCAMVLANGQHMFSCDGAGNYDLYIPLDGDGLITLQVFASGFAPFRQTLTAGQAVGYNVYMDLDTSGRAFAITYFEYESATPGRVRVSGRINYYGTPVCAMILINGSSEFSCDQDLGQFSLWVPLDSTSKITVQAFAAGFMPFRETFISQYDTNPSVATILLINDLYRDISSVFGDSSVGDDFVSFDLQSTNPNDATPYRIERGEVGTFDIDKCDVYWRLIPVTSGDWLSIQHDMQLFSCNDVYTCSFDERRDLFGRLIGYDLVCG